MSSTEKVLFGMFVAATIFGSVGTVVAIRQRDAAINYTHIYRAEAEETKARCDDENKMAVLLTEEDASNAYACMTTANYPQKTKYDLVCVSLTKWLKEKLPGTDL